MLLISNMVGSLPLDSYPALQNRGGAWVKL
jgi:hypothetical protein